MSIERLKIGPPFLKLRQCQSEINFHVFQVKAHGVLNTNGMRVIRWGGAEKFSELSTSKNDQILFFFFERTFLHRFTDIKRERNLDKYEVNDTDR